MGPLDPLGNGGTQLDLHFHSSGSAMLAVLWWLAEIVPGKVAAGKSLTTFEIITGWGQVTGIKADIRCEGIGTEFARSVWDSVQGPSSQPRQRASGLARMGCNEVAGILPKVGNGRC